MPESDPVIYTIGHSHHPIDAFLGLLADHGITCLIDVRSTPYSRIAPQFNKPALQKAVKQRQLLYAHFDQEFGARQTDSALLDEEGIVDFDKVRAAPAFRNGVERLRRALAQGFTVCLMCAEANPFECHRFSMICRELERQGLAVRHILKDSALATQQEIEGWMLQKYHKRLPQSSLFDGVVTAEQQLAFAYRLHNKEVGYRQDQEGEQYD
ncbi:MAG TPA: DUF488 domain-containing protein [Roseiflexaceae bacterium]|nr:DUF488 domain-containing protein [Roseiflexaceae bacterium]